ncbi:MAG TPA: T9SS type A sorting domain-containing protein [Candidatus Kapabacteria bacterium]|nr:T9SS type A sorting domain-containing protein [Candidatus Kapabacteria bacterium]
MSVFYTGTVDAFSKEKVDIKLNSHYDVKYCNKLEDTKEVLITIGIGDVKKSDSLYGFNFSIKYDRSKLYFHSKITTNTLTEFADFSDMSFGIEKGKIIGYGLNNFTLMSGKKDLIGFYGEYIGTICDNDSALVELEYIEFTDEYQNTVNRLDTIWIKPKKVETDYTITTSFLEDNYNYDSTKTNVLSLKAESDKLLKYDYLAYDIQAENNAYLLNLDNLNKDLELEQYEQNEHGFKIVVKMKPEVPFIPNLNLFDIKINRTDKITDTLSKIIVRPIQLSNCNCYNYNKVTGDSIRIKYIASKINNVEDDTHELYQVSIHNNVFSVYSNSNNITKVQLFNSVGEIIINDFINQSSYSKNINLVNGVYFSLIWVDKKVVTRKILINN